MRETPLCDYLPPNRQEEEEEENGLVRACKMENSWNMFLALCLGPNANNDMLIGKN